MRIIAGEYKGRRLKSVPGMATRPTPDRLRESLFSIIESELPGCRFADLFAGTGAVGLEALSRGAAEVVFVEVASRAAEVLRENLANLRAHHVKVLRQPTKKALRSLQADIIFLDPPYDDPVAYSETMTALQEGNALLILVQHPPKQTLAEQYGPFTRTRRLQQGDNAVSFYRRIEAPPVEASSPDDRPSPSP